MANKPKAWHRCNETMMHQLTAATYGPGHIYPYPIDALPPNIQTGMPGLAMAYVSGYCSTSAIGSEFTALGEFAAARTDSTKGKGYNFAFGISSDGGVYYAGPYKAFTEHHWCTSNPVPVAALFGHSSHYYGGSNCTLGFD